MKALAISLSLLVSAPLLAGEATAQDEGCHHPDAPAAKGAKKEEAFVVHRGAKFSGAPEVTLAALLADPQAHAGKTVTVKATVRNACQKKGCWMELSDGEKAPGVRVTFKDYGFFVPLDSKGASAQVEGEVKVAELSEQTAAHYTAEGATVPRGKDGKPREVQLVAAGVELRR